jgi:FkbM family methyltransferase
VIFNNKISFLNALLDQFYSGMHIRVDQNYDPIRYSRDGIDHSNTYPVAIYRDFLKFVILNHEKLFQAYELYEDDASREKFIEVLLYRMLGHPHYKLYTNTREHWAKREILNQLETRPSSLQYNGLWWGKLNHYQDIHFEDEKINYDGWDYNVLWTFAYKQYYFDNGEVRIRPEEGDYLIDGGACFGETSLAFATSAGKTGKVFLLEVLKNHLDIILYNLNQNPSLLNRAAIIPFALSDVVNLNAIPAQTQNLISPGFRIKSEDLDIIPTVTIDYLFETEKIPKLDFIKLDIEGYELQALQGAEQTIKKFRPKLAISLYHKYEDLYKIPVYIKELDLGYKLYFEHYTIFNEETVLYAIAE